MGNIIELGLFISAYYLSNSKSVPYVLIMYSAAYQSFGLFNNTWMQNRLADYSSGTISLTSIDYCTMMAYLLCFAVMLAFSIACLATRERLGYAASFLIFCQSLIQLFSAVIVYFVDKYNVDINTWFWFQLNIQPCFVVAYVSIAWANVIASRTSENGRRGGKFER